MLEEILDYIHNYFVKEIYKGKFKIEEGSLSVDFLQENQYFKVKGSVFNDGIHKFSSDILTDEEFKGEIWAMAVPTRLIELAAEIEEWQEKNTETLSSPYQSESFGGYSYTKATSGSGGGSSQITWRDVFGKKLNAYRKIS